MRVLVTAASRHGATSEIAEVIGEVLAAAGVDVDVRRAEDVGSVTGYDGFVIGSGVYAGHWLEPARKLVEREAPMLADRAVWLFSSGPLGDPPKPEAEPVDVAPLIEATKAIDHRVFPGELDRGRLGLGEKAIVAVVRAPDGDYRPWESIRAWAAEIARAVLDGPLVVARR